MSVAFIQRVSDSSNSALICRIFNKSESYVDALQRLDTQSFGILRMKIGLNRGKCCSGIRTRDSKFHKLFRRTRYPLDHSHFMCNIFVCNVCIVDCTNVISISTIN